MDQVNSQANGNGLYTRRLYHERFPWSHFLNHFNFVYADKRLGEIRSIAVSNMNMQIVRKLNERQTRKCLHCRQMRKCLYCRQTRKCLHLKRILPKILKRRQSLLYVSVGVAYTT